ncbi:MAG: hypothetical protein RLZZ58_1913 [Pseudomonadota bacterium]
MTAAAPDWLRTELVTLAWCWRISRCDGIAIGFTAHDAPLHFDGLDYRPAPGLRPAAVESSDALSPATTDIAAALTSDAIRADDLDAGRWDHARVTLMLVDWTDPDTHRLVLADGELGEVARSGRSFTAELAGVAARFDAPVVPATSPTCRARLGDRACGVDLAARRHRVTIVAADAGSVTVTGLPPGAAMAFGELLWLGGSATGLRTPIIAAAGNVLALAAMPPDLPALPVAALVTQGCDKRLETCRDLYANAANFRGEPLLPGNDLLTRYPGG